MGETDGSKWTQNWPGTVGCKGMNGWVMYSLPTMEALSRGFGKKKTRMGTHTGRTICDVKEAV
jgi:hypothetical protein